MPVRFAAHQAGFPEDGPIAASRLSGTVWQGRMVVDGGHGVTWNTRVAASLAAWAWVADWRLTGPGTELSGGVVLRRAGGSVGPVSGVASWPVVAALMPDLPITCDGQATFVAVAVTVDGALRTGSGSVAVPAATCARSDGQGGAVPVPALRSDVHTLPDSVQAVVTAQEGTGVQLVTARLTAADRLVLTIHKAGAELVPGMPATADSELDLPLSLLTGQ